MVWAREKRDVRGWKWRVLARKGKLLFIVTWQGLGEQVWRKRWMGGLGKKRR
jgi:hypothetical protein